MKSEKRIKSLRQSRNSSTIIPKVGLRSFRKSSAKKKGFFSKKDDLNTTLKESGTFHPSDISKIIKENRSIGSFQKKDLSEIEESSFYVGVYKGPKASEFVILDELLVKIGGAVQPDFQLLVDKLKLILYRRREILNIKSPRLKSLGFSVNGMKKKILTTDVSHNYQINVFHNKYEFNKAKETRDKKLNKRNRSTSKENPKFTN